MACSVFCCKRTSDVEPLPRHIPRPQHLRHTQQAPERPKLVQRCKRTEAENSVQDLGTAKRIVSILDRSSFPFFVSTSDGIQPNIDGLQPNSKPYYSLLMLIFN